MRRLVALFGALFLLAGGCDLFIRSGTITISSEPEGAEVYLDDDFTGLKTDCVLENVPLGNHQLRLTYAGYADWEQTVTINEDSPDATVEADMDKDEVLVLQGVSTREINLMWSSADPTSEWVRYELYRDTSPGVDDTDSLVYTRSGNRLDTTKVDDDLYPATTYYYVVAYVSSGGDVAYSNEVEVTTLSYESIFLPLEGGHGLRIAETGDLYLFCAAREQSVKGLTLSGSGLNAGAVFPHPGGNLNYWAYDLDIVGALGVPYLTLHVAFGKGGYVVYDIDNPSNPTLTKRLSEASLGGQARALDVYGGFAFVGSTDSDVSSHNLHRIPWWGDLNITASQPLSGEPTDVYVDKDYVYVTCLNGRLQIFSWDPADSTDLNPVGSVSTTGAANRVYVSESYAYVAASSSGLLIIDVSNPSSASVVARWSDSRGNDARGVVLEGNILYLVDGRYGLRAIDVSDPLNPRHLFSIDFENDLGDYQLLDAWVLSEPGLTKVVLTDWHHLAFMVEW